MPEPTIPQAQAVIQIIAEHNVAMRNLLKELNESEKPLRAEFDNARKPLHDTYTLKCKELTSQKDARLAGLALGQKQND